MHTSVAIALVFAFIACFVSAQNPPQIPQTPDQFTADVVITMEGGFFPSKVSGHYYYDYPNQRDRIDQTQFGMKVSTINLYNELRSYQFAGPQCKCEALNTTLNPGNVPFGSTYQGLATVNNQNCEVWEWQSPFMPSNEMVMTFFVNDLNEVVRANLSMNLPGLGVQNTIMDFSNIVVGPPGDAAFTPPANCPCPGPAPPPYVPGGSCPGNPDQACQCVASTSLSFCTLVDYPVSTIIDAATLDAFVEQAYTATTAVLPSPSAACLANYKAFLCAFYFPTCIGTESPITFLPCPNLCPFCACGLPVAGNCTAASSPQACTAYGTTSYCS